MRVGLSAHPIPFGLFLTWSRRTFKVFLTGIYQVVTNWPGIQGLNESSAKPLSCCTSLSIANVGNAPQAFLTLCLYGSHNFHVSTPFIVNFVLYSSFKGIPCLYVYYWNVTISCISFQGLYEIFLGVLSVATALYLIFRAISCKRVYEAVRGVTRLEGAPMFETEVFGSKFTVLKKVLVTFRQFPAVIWRLLSDSVPGELCPPCPLVTPLEPVSLHVDRLWEVTVQHIKPLKFHEHLVFWFDDAWRKFKLLHPSPQWTNGRDGDFMHSCKTCASKSSKTAEN